jgi:hypothetical protein
MTGIELIAKERQRQIDVEKWDEKHDQTSAGDMQLIGAAGCYISNALNKYFRPTIIDKTRFQIRSNDEFGYPTEQYVDAWPWDYEYDKREKHNIERSLVIAGALIAAQLDRLQSENG